MSQEKIKEILIALQDNGGVSPSTERERFLQAFAEINKIVMECVPKEAVSFNSGSDYMKVRNVGRNEAIAEFKANWEAK